MRKLFKILIIVGVSVAVITPTVWVSVWFYINNRVETTDVTIDELEITGISDDSLAGTVNFTISDPTTVAATFRIVKFNVSYEDNPLGYGEVTTDEFSTQQASHTTDFTLTITDIDYFQLSFIDDFIASEVLVVDIEVVIEFTGALASIPQKTVTKSVDLAGLNNLPLSLKSFELLDVTEDELQLELSVEVENPSQVSLDIANLYADIYYNDTIIGNVSKSTFSLNYGNNTFEVVSRLSGSNALLSDFIGTYLSPDNIFVDLNLTISLAEFSGDSFKIARTIDNLEVKGVEEDLVSVAIDMINLDISGLPGSVTYTIDTTVTIHNPVAFDINVTNFDGLLTYDDADGVFLQILLLIWDYPAENNITLTPVSFDWSGSPLEIPSLGDAQDTFSFVDSNIEQGVRLNDEYYIDNDLHVNIIFGTVTIQIYSFIIDVPIEIFDIYVSST